MKIIATSQNYYADFTLQNQKKGKKEVNYGHSNDGSFRNHFGKVFQPWLLMVINFRILFHVN